MPVPEEIRKVERPKNSIVKLIGNKYAVIERIGCKRKNKSNIPINGHVIGHIIDYKYVPKPNKNIDISLKTYGDYKLASNLSSDLLKELTDCYGERIATSVYVISILRAIYPSLKDYQIEDAYEESFVSNDYSNLNLKKNTVSKLIRDLGHDYSKALLFMQNRIDKVDDKNKIVIDGMLKNNNSRINSLSDFSYKSKLKQSQEISIIVAFDATRKEILCSIPYSGNTVDSTAFPDFIEKTNIKKGIIIGDKGISNGKDIDNIGFLFPLKRSSKILSSKLDIYKMDEKIENKDNPILCKKVFYENRYYYAYRDLKRAAKEEQDFVNSKKFSIEELNKRKDKFGTIVFISNQDLTLEETYKLYRQRWEIELVNKFYKNILELDTVREHDDYSILGSEFINLISSIIGNRIKNKFSEQGLFKKYTYQQIMKKLKKYKKIKLPIYEDSWIDLITSKKEAEIIDQLLYSV